ncbi:MAG: hypothetical protein WBY44_07585 [Bryobacteraceae bacterium]
MNWRARHEVLSYRPHWSLGMDGAGRILRSRTIAMRLRGAFLLGFCALAAAHASEWKVSIVPDVPGGKFSSLKMDSYGNAHVVHMDGFDNMIRYSFWDRTLNKWFSTDLERGSGFCSLVLDSKQRPHISYPAGTGVIHRFWDGEKWQRQFADVHARVINYYTSIVLDANDYPSISFYEEAGAGDTCCRLRIVVWNGTFWDLKTIDATHGSGKFNSMAMNSRGHPEIAIGNVEYMTLSLRYARWNGEAWNVEILDNTVSSKWSVAMVLDKNDSPHIVYTDVQARMVKYAAKRAGRWEIEAVDSIVRHAYPDRNGIAVDAEGTPYVSYYDAGLGVLKVAHRVKGRWVTEVVDQDYAGYTSSMQIANDTIWLTYGDERGELLRFAHRPIKPPASAMNPEPAAIKR